MSRRVESRRSVSRGRRGRSPGTSSDEHGEPERAGARTASSTDVVCTFCGCLCDDIELQIEGDRITEARNACPLGQAWFLGYRTEEGPACLIEGQPATFEEGVERAARILAEAAIP